MNRLDFLNYLKGLPSTGKALSGQMDYGDERLPQRFWDKVYPEPNTGCWLWVGSTSNTGYGNITIGSRVDKSRKTYPVHVLVCSLVHGTKQEGLEVCHSCHIRCCVNPDHLRWDTRLANRDDSRKSGRLRGGQSGMTHCRRGHEFNLTNTYTAPGSGKRRCLACRKSWELSR